MSANQPISFDVETGPQEGVLSTKFAPKLEPFEPKPFKAPKRLVKDTDESYQSKLEEAQQEHAEAILEAQEGHTEGFEKRQQDFLDECCLYPHLGRVLVIGLFSDDKFVAIEGDEKRILEIFWLQVGKCQKQHKLILGHNIFNFDLPFLIRRSWALGVKVPSYVCVPNGKYVNWLKLFQDTASLWLMGQYSRDTKWSLDCIGHCFGTGGKTVEGVEGKGFWRHYAADKQAALAYLENDCRQTLAIYERMVPPIV